MTNIVISREEVCFGQRPPLLLQTWDSTVRTKADKTKEKQKKKRAGKVALYPATLYNILALFNKKNSVVNTELG